MRHGLAYVLIAACSALSVSHHNFLASPNSTVSHKLNNATVKVSPAGGGNKSANVNASVSFANGTAAVMVNLTANTSDGKKMWYHEMYFGSPYNQGDLEAFLRCVPEVKGTAVGDFADGAKVYRVVKTVYNEAPGLDKVSNILKAYKQYLADSAGSITCVDSGCVKMAMVTTAKQKEKALMILDADRVKCTPVTRSDSQFTAYRPMKQATKSPKCSSKSWAKNLVLHRTTGMKVSRSAKPCCCR
mmetsp:Transcript_40032/g.87365  ORF Transcript_40032/g.87365 Transcript_40032/m.87365 type:complete len:244 (+) Transcript_40032:46-777(+)